MRDIAQATGVSQSTVSRVLSGTPTAVPIAEATRKRVVETARELGYRPNPLARGLRGAPTMLLGVIVRDIMDPSFPTIIEIAAIIAGKQGYNVVLGHAHGNADEAVELWSILEARHCDAILLLGDLSDRPALIEDLHDTREPVVALWHGERSTVIPTVNVDNRVGVITVMDHLISLGHCDIAFVAGKPLGDIVERKVAYEELVRRTCGSVRGEFVVETSNDYQGGIDALHELMDLGSPPTAIVGATDVIAIGMLHGAHQRGLRVPEDISVTGFDDIPFSAVTVPALTTMRMPVPAMVGAAIDLIIDELDGGLEDDVDTHPVFEAELVVRASTGPAPTPTREGA